MIVFKPTGRGIVLEEFTEETDEKVSEETEAHFQILILIPDSTSPKAERFKSRLYKIADISEELLKLYNYRNGDIVVVEEHMIEDVVISHKGKSKTFKMISESYIKGVVVLEESESEDED